MFFGKVKFKVNYLLNFIIIFKLGNLGDKSCYINFFYVIFSVICIFEDICWINDVGGVESII